MEYTVQKLARLSGVSPRTLRFYDEIGILKPARINSSGYRIYGKAEVDLLQQILFYKALGVSLERIREIITSPDFDRVKALQEHRERLLDKRHQLDILIANVEKTLASMEGKITMTDREKFEGFKRKWVEENEAKYGREIREKYGDEAVEASNRKVLDMTPEQYEEVTRLSEEIHKALAEAFAEGDPASEKARKVAELHKRWLTFFWNGYNKEAHAGVAKMYVEDERFKAYYEKQPGMAEFLRDAILHYTGVKE
ncbi:MerR family transcriptional regulator [Staphylospora marina]|uniref:MerR family transcriptional regulator n=1 Tax=Staphylospora marina TaxID=2490858 RepID=UPI000F5BC128|nr:MerR family transcriptional regulator [Staphylospora marina]